MLATPGNINIPISPQIQQVSIVDENYTMIGCFTDESIKNKIINHEYVDFAQLIPRD